VRKDGQQIFELCDTIIAVNVVLSSTRRVSGSGSRDLVIVALVGIMWWIGNATYSSDIVRVNVKSSGVQIQHISIPLSPQFSYLWRGLYRL